MFGPSQPAFEALANSSGVELGIPPELRFSLLRYGQAKDFLEVVSARELQEWQNLMKPYLLEYTDARLSISGPERPTPPEGAGTGAGQLYSDPYFRNLWCHAASALRRCWGWIERYCPRSMMCWKDSHRREHERLD